VITYQPVGNGRVVVVEGTGMWRWAFLPPQHQQHDAVYGTLWRSLMRWLVTNVGLLPSQQLALRSDKAMFHTSETASGTLLLRNAGPLRAIPEVELSGGALRAPQHITPLAIGSAPNQFRVPFGKLPEGRYEARVAGVADASGKTAFDVRGSLEERLEVAARPDLMKMIAEESGGTVLRDANPQQLLRNFEKYLSASRPPRVVRIPAWDRWWVLVSVCALWCLAWSVRRKAGLV
jgi:hypothetical protein